MYLSLHFKYKVLKLKLLPSRCIQVHLGSLNNLTQCMLKEMALQLEEALNRFHLGIPQLKLIRTKSMSRMSSSRPRTNCNWNLHHSQRLLSVCPCSCYSQILIRRCPRCFFLLRSVHMIGLCRLPSDLRYGTLIPIHTLQRIIRLGGSILRSNKYHNLINLNIESPRNLKQALLVKLYCKKAISSTLLKIIYLF